MLYRFIHMHFNALFSHKLSILVIITHNFASFSTHYIETVSFHTHDYLIKRFIFSLLSQLRQYLDTLKPYGIRLEVSDLEITTNQNTCRRLVNRSQNSNSYYVM